MTIIRPAQRSDASALSELARKAYAHYTERMGKEPAPMKEDYRALVETGGVWVAERDGVLVGLLVLKLEPDHVLLDNVAVSPDAQGSGLGARLLEFTDDQARQHGVAEVRLYTNEAMAENLAYYARRGFVETHRAVDHGYRRVFFTKRL
ncbi:GNAT family N-acetyltransferase [Saccharopolyspora sp. K220]|uniref:GNAT family N-acetyltransferase n=1 Tax=Saccharopolyspora soli TaxID=2926618 RepID=UPI001F5744CA|nr:GNAT family N-acetyltransferase [Saccharopolyspora soli]MCI2417912.1 GNAT family N-acetyltransferase [Saccharopolyspora soli]